MKIRFKHTNIVASDWRRLAEFYCNALQCVTVPPERHLSGTWLARGTGVKNAKFSGVHLRLPGEAEPCPTLEIYQYEKNESKLPPAANREGLAHLAFEVENVRETLEHLIRHGGFAMGEVVSHIVKGVGTLTFVYASDPEGNIIELQNWKY